MTLLFMKHLKSAKNHQSFSQHIFIKISLVPSLIHRQVFFQWGPNRRINDCIDPCKSLDFGFSKIRTQAGCALQGLIASVQPAKHKT